MDEDDVALYCLSGAAMHSMLKLRAKKTDPVKAVLEMLRIKDKKSTDLPVGIQLLDRGHLILINPIMLPYVKMVLHIVTQLVNDHTCENYGSHMIEVCKSHVERNSVLKVIFR